jgi:hypothetical protein
MALLTALTVLAFTTAGSVVASAASPSGPAPAVSPLNSGQGQNNNNQNNNNQGQNGQNGQNNNNQGQNGQGQGTRTPELPSGVLFGIGLLPLLVGILWLRRRGRTVRA